MRVYIFHTKRRRKKFYALKFMFVSTNSNSFEEEGDKQ